MFVGALFIALALFGCSKADTPADCRFDDIVGNWIFYESDRGHDLNVDCDTITDFKHQTQIELSFPDIAADQYGNRGVWTLIYNEGFEITINSRRYFAFQNWTTDSQGTVTSHCDLTNPGWSHDLYVRDWSCYYGKRTGPPPSTSNKNATRPSYKPQLERLAKRKYRTNHAMINQINRMQSSWKAKAYPEHEQYSLLDVLRRKGGVNSIIANRPKPAPITAEQQALADQLPASLDWRNVSGVNYVSPVRDQGGCGSCYAFAAMGMLESRYRIVTNNAQQPVFSPEDVVDCSEYAQGCDGGFPYLISGKYAEDFGVVTEDCNPYKHVSTSETDTCNTSPNCRRYYATNYRYIGGYYGANNEPLMRAAVVNNGPIAVGFEVYDDFMSYTSGVYHHTGVTDKLNNLDWDPFYEVDHAVLIVGYGTEEGTNTPYWIVKNSWGTGFGEDGYFQIVRGTNECGIETLASESTPIGTY